MSEDAKIAKAIKAILAAQAALVDVEWLLQTTKGYNKARAASKALHVCLTELYDRAPTIDLPPPPKRKGIGNEPFGGEET